MSLRRIIHLSVERDLVLRAMIYFKFGFSESPFYAMYGYELLSLNQDTLSAW